jgi:peptidoglycan/xylan/chitin deacetylase (PgdA/CDA1 family)
MRKVLFYILLIILTSNISFSQCAVSITIDDIPNTRQYEKDGYKSLLLAKLDSLKIPIAIFINEGFIYTTDSVVKNFSIFNEWVKRDYITLGTHTFSHLRYSETNFDLFKNDLIKGQNITSELAKKNNKSVSYFRFPFNDLGKDSLQHELINDCLKEKGYTITPFTIESSDYMFNTLYSYYLKTGDKTKAKKIEEKYIEITLEYFDYFDSIGVIKHDRHVNQIFLCHENALNINCLPVLYNVLKVKGYSFISLNEALKDKIYSQNDLYFDKWGISWFYRWIEDKEERTRLMRNEPKMEDIEKDYNMLQKDGE